MLLMPGINRLLRISGANCVKRLASKLGVSVPSIILNVDAVAINCLQHLAAFCAAPVLSSYIRIVRA